MPNFYIPNTPKMVTGETPLGLAQGPILDAESSLQATLASAINQNPYQFAVKGVTLAGLAAQYAAWLTEDSEAFPFILDGPSIASLMTAYFTGANPILLTILAKIPTDPTGARHAGFLGDANVFGSVPAISSNSLATQLDLSAFAFAINPTPTSDPNDAAANPNMPPSPGIWHIQGLLAGPRWFEGEAPAGSGSYTYILLSSGEVIKSATPA